jgi:hypothetical protein
VLRRLAVIALVGFALATPQAQSIPVARFSRNPLITVSSSPTLGTNVNGATVVRVPDRVEHPLGRYYIP